MNRAVIGLGSNIEPEQNVSRALKAIAGAHALLARSRLVETPPIGQSDQPNYLNGAVLIETAMTRDDLKAWLRKLED